jgi:insulysin
MLEFFLQYIAPKSLARAKLSVHLHARGISEVSTPVEKATTELIADALSDMVEKSINMLKIDSKPVQLTNGDVSHENMAKRDVSEPYLIKDIREFRSRLVASAGPQPVKDLSEFEELDCKL